MLEEVVAQASIPVDAEADAEDQSAFNRFVDDLSPAALVRHLRDRRDQGQEGESDASDDSPASDQQ